MTLILDAGGLIAAEAGEVRTWHLIARERDAGRRPRTHGGVVAQVWRGGFGRQVRLARLLPHVDVVPVDSEFGKQAGVLLGLARTSDAVDALVIALARDGDEILTSDPGDLRVLAQAANLHVDIVRV